MAKTMQLMRAELRIDNQELKAELNGLREEVRTGFDQMYRHIDGFTKLHETLDIEMKVMKEQMKRLEERVKILEAS